ncbi:hypothetical protein [Nostoc commune]|uniref:hypothetical protein n=1 Tax=Nostoc commune TaxID=1178 RepID=UPI0018C5D652|nr:hypothetical protein [Nostoc commune]MBG1262651.1 hypothetical protein [Nostoc commune BAE]
MQQLNLFTELVPVLPVTYYPDFLSIEQANELYQHCLKLEWQPGQTHLNIDESESEWDLA